MRINIFSHYKTSLCGFLSVALSLYIGFTSKDWLISVPLFTSGIGLLLAKDGDK